MTAALDSYLILLHDLSGIQLHAGVVGNEEEEKVGEKINRFLRDLYEIFRNT